VEDFSHAVELYKSLVTEVDAQEENDLRINTGATDAQLEWKRLGNFVTKKRAGREDLEAFETAYNAACGCIARGELGQGELLLKRAKGMAACSSHSGNAKIDIR
jgi:signal recognition particle subunit SRP72